MMLSAGKYRGLSRLADGAGRFKMVAVDQRPPIENPIRAARGGAEAPWEDVAAFKRMLVEELQGQASAMLLDPHYAYPVSVRILDPHKGLILTLEDSVVRGDARREAFARDHRLVGGEDQAHRRRRREGARLVSA